MALTGTPVSATVTDLAGNSKTVTQDVVIDTKIDQDGDGNTVAITSITDDTGASGSDFITNDNTLVFNGTVDLGDDSTWPSPSMAWCTPLPTACGLMPAVTGAST